jgi:Uncharacterised nucleotidyltransferase
MPGGPAASGGFFEAAHSIRLDLVAAEVADALDKADVRCIVLRGPSLTGWLYPEKGGRNYIDVDLLVAPRDFDTAERILAGLGFDHVPTMMQRPDDRPVHARTWTRQADLATVDVHRTIVGARAPDETVWSVMSRETEPIRVGTSQLEGLSVVATALVVALHAAQHGDKSAKQLGDLERGVERLPRDVWEAARRLASSLEAAEAFEAGLRLLPAGADLAESLGLATNSPTTETALRASSPPPTALGFEWLANVPGLRAKLRLLGAKALPDAEFMRAWSPLARRGTAGLCLAYLWRPLWLAWHAPRGYLAWVHARRTTRR